MIGKFYWKIKGLFYYLYFKLDSSVFLKEEKLQKRFNKEISLLKNRHENHNNNQSVLYFTMRKSGSVYSGQVLSKLVSEAGMTAINFVDYYYNGGRIKRRLYRCGMLGKVVVKKKGYFYGPLRSFCNGISGINDFKIILMLRDPRDALVSEYFSIAYSHPLPPKENDETFKLMSDMRKKALEITIDKFVLDAAQGFSGNFYNYHGVYSAYCRELLHRPNVFLIKYEDMVTDFKTWLYAAKEFMGIEVKKEVMDKLIAEANFNVGSENIYNHKRQVTPGDHRRKLKSETIGILNSRFAGILDMLGYPKE